MSRGRFRFVILSAAKDPLLHNPGNGFAQREVGADAHELQVPRLRFSALGMTHAEDGTNVSAE
jgi:hypothetical protein